MPRIRYRNQRVTFVGQGRAGSIRTAELEQQRMCDGKRSYIVYAEAQLACWDTAQYEREQGRDDSAARLHVYLCPYANHYHVGHSTGCVLVTPMLSSDTHEREGNGMAGSSDVISQDVIDRFITAIGEKGGAISSKDGRVGIILAAMTGVSAGRVAAVLRRMSDRDHKLIKLDRGKPGNKRTYNVWLTDAGTARWVELQERAERGAAPPEPPAVVTNDADDTDVTNVAAYGQHGQHGQDEQRDRIGVTVADLTPDETEPVIDKSGVLMTPAEVAEARGEMPKKTPYIEMPQVNFRITPAMRRALKQRANARGGTMQDEFYAALLAYLAPAESAEQQEPRLPGWSSEAYEAGIPQAVAAQPTAQDIATGMLVELRRLWEQEDVHKSTERAFDAVRDDLTEQMRKAREERDDLAKQLEESRENSDVRAELDRVGNDLNHANRVIAAKQQDIERLRTELAEAKARNEVLARKANDTSFLTGMGPEELGRLVKAANKGR